MVSKTLLIAAVVAYVEARFGQEQVPIAAIQAVQGGDPGAASTIAGAAISDLLGAADPCAKLSRADDIVAQLGTGADAIAAAIGMVTAEKNTNPFANGNAQTVCDDPTLPATAELRGITPLIDPAVDVDGAAAALSQQTAGAPLAADGLSVLQLMQNNGLGDLVSAPGGAAAGGAAAGGNAGNADAGNANTGNAATGNADAGNADAGNAATGNAGNATGNANTGNADAGNQNAGNADAGNANAGAAAGGAADFGQCTPTIFRAGGLGGRPADEFTFQIEDPLARGGQQEALNPNIITNALCNQLTNVCGANAAAVSQCEDAKAQVEAAGTRDDSTVTLFNNAVLGGAAKRSMRRGWRL